MGLVLDSSVLIIAEREAKPVSSLLAEFQRQHGENDVVLSSITVVELEHGLHRAQTPEQAQKRRNYLDEVFAAIPVESFSREMAQIAAKVDADARRVGKVIPFADFPHRCNRFAPRLRRWYAKRAPFQDDSKPGGCVPLISAVQPVIHNASGFIS